MARDEADIIGATVAHLLAQGARVVVADNLSVDDTGDIARALGAEVELDEEPAYFQCFKMSALAAKHAKEGEWVIPFDADEIWSGLENLTDKHDIATTSPHVHVSGAARAIMPERQPKVAFRWREGIRISMGNHSVEGAGSNIGAGLLEVCHYQYRTLDQVKRKVRQGVAAYDLANFGKDSYGSHWRELAALDDDELAEWWDTYLKQATTVCQVSAL